MLSRDEILTMEDLKPVPVEVPEWGGNIFVRGATAAEMDEYDSSLVYTKVEGDKSTVVSDFKNTRARLVVKCIVNEAGERVFTDKDAELLGKKSSAAVNRLFQKINQLSGRAKESLKALEGNSGAGQDASLPLS